MPTQFKITAPDGAVYNVTGPDGATEEDALKQVQAQHSDTMQAKVDAPSGAISDATEQQLRRNMPMPQFTPQHTGFSAQVGAALDNTLPVHAPAPTAAELGRQWTDVGKGVVVGAPSGIVGIPGDVESIARHVASKVAPVSTGTILPTSEQVGNDIAGQPSSPEEAAGRVVGNLVGPGLAVKGLKSASGVMARTLSGAGPTEAAQAAHDAGYVLPPAMASEKPGIVSQGLSALSGKIKLQQAASAKNQTVTNQLAAQSLGLSGDTQLTEHSLASVRASASETYKKLANSVPEIVPDEAFKATVSGLGKRQSEAAKAFPGLVKNNEVEGLVETLSDAQSFSPQAGLEVVRHLRSDASANLRAFNDPGKQALGLAQRQAADAVDDLMERNLSAVGKPDLVNEYRDARQLLARTYDVKAATNLDTGNVNARMVAALGRKGRPLGDQLKEIARVANAFPKAVQSMATVGGEERLGIFDIGAAGLSHGATIPLSLARPSARTVLLSAPYQERMMSMSPVGIPNSLDQLSAALALPTALRPENPLNRAMGGSN